MIFRERSPTIEVYARNPVVSSLCVRSRNLIIAECEVVGPGPEFEPELELKLAVRGATCVIAAGGE